MISLENLNIYKKYNGDIDGWARSADRNELELIDDSEWLLIDQLIQQIQMVNSGVTSESFENQLN